MTLDEVRDKIAGLMGWKYSFAGGGKLWHNDPKWPPGGPGSHPVPTTLDGIAALWKERLPNMMWGRGYGHVLQWWSMSKGDFGLPSIRIDDTDNELEDRTRLLLAVLEAQAEEQGNVNR